MSLAKRVDALESRYKPEDWEWVEMKKALAALTEALHKSLASDEPKLVKSPIYSHASSYDYKGCLWFGDKLALLIKNMESGAINEGDRAVLDGLPQWALDETNMSAVDYVVMVNELINRF